MKFCSHITSIVLLALSLRATNPDYAAALFRGALALGNDALVVIGLWTWARDFD